MSGFYLWNTKWYRECGIEDVDSHVFKFKKKKKKITFFDFYTQNKLLNVTITLNSDMS